MGNGLGATTGMRTMQQTAGAWGICANAQVRRGPAEVQWVTTDPTCGTMQRDEHISGTAGSCRASRHARAGGLSVVFVVSGKTTAGRILVP